MRFLASASQVPSGAAIPGTALSMRDPPPERLHPAAIAEVADDHGKQEKQPPREVAEEVAAAELDQEHVEAAGHHLKTEQR